MKKYYMSYTYLRKDGNRVFEGCFVTADTINESEFLDGIAKIEEKIGTENRKGHVIPLSVVPLDEDTCDEEDADNEISEDICEEENTCNCCKCNEREERDTEKECCCVEDKQDVVCNLSFKDRVRALKMVIECLFGDTNIEDNECKKN